MTNKKYTLWWTAKAEFEGNNENEAKESFITLILDGFYGPVKADIKVQENLIL